MVTNKQVPLDDLLDWITANVYDYGHGLLPNAEWVVDAYPLLEKLQALAGMNEQQMKEAFDWARIRVHGPNVKGGR